MNNKGAIRKDNTYFVRQAEGFTLVELMVAMAILMLIVFAFTPLLLGSIERIHYAGDKSEALYQGQAEMEVNIVQKETIDGHEFIFEFDDNVTVTVPGGFIEVEQSKNDAVARLSTFLPYVPSIRLSDPFLIEGYDGDNSNMLSMVIMGSDTKMEDSDYVYIFKRERFEQGGSANYDLPFNVVSQPEGQPSGYDEYVTFNLPAGPNGLINANSPHIVELNWVAGDLTVHVRARLHITLPRAVIVGDGGAIWVSPDAKETWNARNNEVEITAGINDVIWANFRYVAVTATGKALIWGNQEEPQLIDIPGLTGISLNSLAFGGGKLVAVGNDGTLAVSVNGGQTWSLEDSGTGADLHAISHNGSEFVAVGKGGIIITSANGTEWQELFSGVPGDHIDFYGIAYGNGVWVVVGDIRPADPAASRRYLIYRGTTGGSWEEEARGSSTSSLYGVSYSVLTDPDAVFNEKFAAVGSDGRIMTSADGSDWVAGSKTTATLNRIFWDGFWNNQFIIVGSGGTVLTGTGDSGDWAVNSAGSNNLKGVTIRWEN